MTGFITPVQTFKCPECGHTLLYVGRGRHRCTNPECPVIEASVTRRGTLFRVLRESVPYQEAMA